MSQTASPQVEMIPVARIIPGMNDRKTFDPDALRELAHSIREHGLLQPITLRRLEGRYRIVAGERRFRAMTALLGWSTVPALVRELTDAEEAALMLLENTARVELNPIEEATAYQVRLEKFAWTLTQVAETAGVSLARVQRRLGLLRLLPEVQLMVKAGHFPLGHAELLHDLDANRQAIALRLFRESAAMPLAHFRQIVGQLRAEQDQEALFQLEDLLTVQVQQAAQIATRGKTAVPHVPTRPDLPPVAITPRDTTAAVIARYITTLQHAGHSADAATLGTLFSALVKGNFLAIPPNL